MCENVGELLAELFIVLPQRPLGAVSPRDDGGGSRQLELVSRTPSCNASASRVESNHAAVLVRSSGRERSDAGEESAAQREATRAAASGVEVAAAGLRAAAHTERLHRERAAEAQALRQAARDAERGGRGGRGGAVQPVLGRDGKLRKEEMSYQQREKRKRERGQAQGGRNFIEEEKRIQRQQFGSNLAFDS